MSTISTIPPQIERKLKRLRRGVKLWLWIDGLGWLCACLTGLIFLSLLIDWTLRMDQVQRGLSLLIGGALILVAAYRRLIRPLLRPIELDRLCMHVESRHNRFGQSLINAVQLARIQDPQALGISPTMIRATIEQSARTAEDVDFQDTLDRTALKRNLVIVAVALAVVLTSFAGCESTMSTWFNRNVLLGSQQWSQKTHLKVHNVMNGTVALPRGDDWEQLVTAEGVVPHNVKIDYSAYQGAHATTEQMVRVAERDFRVTFNHVIEPFVFRAYGGDDMTPWIQTQLVDRPSVESIQLTLNPPTYISGKSRSLPPDEGPYEAPHGSSVSVTGLSTKQLIAAQISYSRQTLPLELDGKQSFHGRIGPEALQSSSYHVLLTDSDHLTSKQATSFTIKVIPDRNPMVRASLEGIGGLIVKEATIPVRCHVSDDHGIAECALAYEVRRNDGTTDRKDRIQFTHLGERLGSTQFDELYHLDVAPLHLEIGSQMTFHIEAHDYDDVVGPNSGQSSSFFFSIVTEQELRSELLRREQEQRQQFERLLNDQEDLLADTRVIIAATQSVEDTSESPRQRLTKIGKRQRLVGDRCEAIAQRFSQIADEVHNNKLEGENGKVQARLRSGIIKPLGSLAEKSVPAVTEQLDVALREETDSLRNQLLLDATHAQERIITTMRKILNHMVKWEGYHEAVTLLHEILKAQDTVNQATTERREKRIRSIFEDSAP